MNDSIVTSCSLEPVLENDVKWTSSCSSDRHGIDPNGRAVRAIRLGENVVVECDASVPDDGQAVTRCKPVCGPVDRVAVWCEAWIDVQQCCLESAQVTAGWSRRRAIRTAATPLHAAKRSGSPCPQRQEPSASLLFCRIQPRAESVATLTKPSSHVKPFDVSCPCATHEPASGSATIASTRRVVAISTAALLSLVGQVVSETAK